MKLVTEKDYKTGLLGFIEDCNNNFLEKLLSSKEPKWIIKPQFDNGMCFYQGTACVEKDGKHFYINEKGNNIFGNKTFLFAYPFIDSIAAIQISKQDFRLMTIQGHIFHQSFLEIVRPNGNILGNNNSVWVEITIQHNKLFTTPYLPQNHTF